MQKVIDVLFALHFGFKTKSTFALDSAFEILKHSNNNTHEFLMVRNYQIVVLAVEYVGV